MVNGCKLSIGLIVDERLIVIEDMRREETVRGGQFGLNLISGKLQVWHVPSVPSWLQFELSEGNNSMCRLQLELSVISRWRHNNNNNSDNKTIADASRRKATLAEEEQQTCGFGCKLVQLMRSTQTHCQFN